MKCQWQVSVLSITARDNMSPYTSGLHTGNPAPFLYTPTSLLLEHSVLTDVQQARGRNGQQWITCRSGREGTRPEIWMGSERVVNSSIANFVTIGLGIQHPNGLYHCFSAQSQREYFSLYLSNSGEQMCDYQTKLIKLTLGCEPHKTCANCVINLILDLHV